MTNPRYKVAVSFEWKHVGAVSVERDGKLVFPKTNSFPTVYRFDFVGLQRLETYVGETDNLSRRLQHYRTPGPTQRTNQRLNEKMQRAISGGLIVSLSKLGSPVHVELGNNKRAADMSLKHERVLLEHAAICDAYERGFTVLNG